LLIESDGRVLYKEKISGWIYTPEELYDKFKEEREKK
jgi:hypothetical protein